MKTLIFCLLCLSLFNVGYAQVIEYNDVEPNVPYAQVAKLTHISANEVFVYGQDPEQKIYHWQALNAETNAMRANKQLIFIHGGCWLAQFDIQHSNALSTAFAQAGFSVYSIEYRRAGNGGEWPVAFDDIMLALEKIATVNNEKLASIGTEAPPHTFILGHSAGGHLASLAANFASKQYSNTSLYPLFSQTHFVGLAPIIDIFSYAEGKNSCQRATPLFMGGEPSIRQNAYQNANPLKLALQGLETAITMIGSQDSIVPPDMAIHPNVRYDLLPQVGHFDWIHPGSDAFKHLLTHIDSVHP